MVRGHALYEGTYLLGTSIARPLIAKLYIPICIFVLDIQCRILILLLQFWLSVY